MTTRLIIVRHGNTFAPGDTPTRVGARTDIPLVTSGVEQAKALGHYFTQQNIKPTVIYSAELKRTKQTAQYAFPKATIETLSFLNEIDYGPDENQTEATVISRIGEQAIALWNQKAIVPPGWQVNPKEIIQAWHAFADMIADKFKNETIVVVTSNGIARFAPYITNEFDAFTHTHNIKLKTGAFGVFEKDKTGWVVSQWNVRP